MDRRHQEPGCFVQRLSRHVTGTTAAYLLCYRFGDEHLLSRELKQIEAAALGQEDER